MATLYKRKGARGVRWTARVRVAGREETRTFATKMAAESWAKAREVAFERGEFVAPRPGTGPLFADLIDGFIAHRATIRRPPGKTFASALARLKDQHGLEPAVNLTPEFWRKHALDRIKGGVQGQTVASELAYASSVLRFAAEAHAVDATGPAKARAFLRDRDGIRVTSRERARRITDEEIAALLGWFDDNAGRTKVPMRAIVEFALATAMRRGEILALQHADIAGRVATIKRKHPRERDRVESVPLLKPGLWPKVDPLEIIARQPKGGRVFPYLGDTVSFWFEAATKALKLKGVVFHSLRHECLSRLAQDRKFDPLRLAKVGGHRDLRNVRRYANLDAEALANE